MILEASSSAEEIIFSAWSFLYVTPSKNAATAQTIPTIINIPKFCFTSYFKDFIVRKFVFLKNICFIPARKNSM